MPAHRTSTTGSDSTGNTRRGLDRSLRIIGGLVLLAAAAAIIVGQAAVRDNEMEVAGHWFGLVLNGKPQTVGDTIYFPWTGGPLIGLRDTMQCTVALLATPLCVLGGLLLAATRIPWRRLLLGLSAALAAVVIVNQLRLVMIAVATQHWGRPGYHVSHQIVGTLFALAGFAASLLLLFKIVAKRPRAEGRS